MKWKKSVAFRGERGNYKHITARKVGNQDDAEAELALFASLSGQEPAVFEEMDMVDYKKVQETYQRFLS